MVYAELTWSECIDNLILREAAGAVALQLVTPVLLPGNAGMTCTSVWFAGFAHSRSFTLPFVMQYLFAPYA